MLCGLGKTGRWIRPERNLQSPVWGCNITAFMGDVREGIVTVTALDFRGEAWLQREFEWSSAQRWFWRPSMDEHTPAEVQRKKREGRSKPQVPNIQGIRRRKRSLQKRLKVQAEKSQDRQESTVSRKLREERVSRGERSQVIWCLCWGDSSTHCCNCSKLATT